jgi:hypothetical protein
VQLYQTWDWSENKPVDDRIIVLVKDITGLILRDNGVPTARSKRVAVDLKSHKDDMAVTTLWGITYYSGAFRDGAPFLVDTIYHECAHVMTSTVHTQKWHDSAVRLGMLPGYSTRV